MYRRLTFAWHHSQITELTTGDSFDLFYALYKHTPAANEQIAMLREAVSQVRCRGL